MIRVQTTMAMLCSPAQFCAIADQVQVFRVGGAPTFTHFNPTMPFVGGLGILQRSVLEVLGLIHSKQDRNIFKQVSLVLFDAQNIVRIGFHNGFGDIRLGSHGINGHNTA